MDLSFIYFGNDWFAENRTSSHHIARRLSNRFPLLYVETPGLRAPEASRRDIRKLFKKLAAAFRPPRQISEHMWHISVPQIPYRRYAAVRKINELFALWKVRSALRRVPLFSPLSWFNVPHPGFLAGKLGERMVVYYCTDNYAAAPGVDATDVARMDEALTRRADVVFATSPSLVHEKQRLNETVIYSPHGVDADVFGKAADLTLPIAEPARNLSHPVIGFFGVLDGRIDPGMIEFLATSRPHWSFLLVGRVAIDARRLSRLSNVCMPGNVPYEMLPDWARAFDVCIMPYRQDAFSLNANPLKLREYLATGRPVVSIPTAEVEQFSGFVSVAATNEEFLAAIEKELAADSEERRRERIRLVSPATWDARVEVVIATTVAQLKKQTSRG